jgi:hypothetical protein
VGRRDNRSPRRPGLTILATSTADAQLTASIVLVVVTAVYAGFTLLAVLEAGRTRRQQVRPVLALDLVTVEQSFYIEVAIVNVGQGAAVDVDLELTFYPSREGREPVRRRFTWPLIRPGQHYQFAPPKIDEGDANHPVLEEWAPVYPRVELTGTVNDQLGKSHDVHVTLPDVAELHGRAVDAVLAGPRTVAAQRQFKALSEAGTAISKTLGRIESALSRRGGADGGG